MFFLWFFRLKSFRRKLAETAGSTKPNVFFLYLRLTKWEKKISTSDLLFRTSDLTFVQPWVYKCKATG